MKKLLVVIIAGSFLVSAPTWAFKDFIKDIHGFLEVGYGYRKGNRYTKHRRYNFLEKRLQFKFRKFPEYPEILYDWNAVLNFKADFLVDGYYDAKTEFALREFNLTVSPIPKLDIKIGRQILTWGTGDYLFINDVFPKDYISFFIGRDDEYLKAPSWAVKTSYFGEAAWIDFVLIPYFEPNIIPQGDRLSFYDTLLGRIAGRQSDWFKREPAFQPHNFQQAVRIYKQQGSLEWALYFYRGFYNNPNGYKNIATFELYYPRLNVYGFSLRGPVYKGIANLEAGWYDSKDDRSGRNRLITNSSIRTLVGYTQDFKNDLTLGFQYYFEQMLEYKDYKKNLLPQDTIYDEYRHLLTFNISKMFRNQTVVVSNFVFFSPSDRDAYLRSSVSYTIKDNLRVALGVNLFWGDDDYTEFGQMEGNANIYLRLRYSF